MKIEDNGVFATILRGSEGLALQEFLMTRRKGIRFTLISLFLSSFFLAGLCKAQDNTPAGVRHCCAGGWVVLGLSNSFGSSCGLM
jgi:hypothetical protein